MRNAEKSDVGRLRNLMPRLVALSLVWLLATAALTYAATLRSGASPAAAVHTTVAKAPSTVVVPDVRNQAFVFAKGILTDAGFGWKVMGGVQGYASNMVVSQSPAAGTRVIDTGEPTIEVRLERSGAQIGVPEQVSSPPGTALKLARLADATVPVRKAATAKAKPAVKTTAAKKAM